MTPPVYAKVAEAPGTWTCPILLPESSFEEIRGVLTALARDTGWPVAAFLYGLDGWPVTELLLYRDPSRTFGTPCAEECDAAVRALVAATGWTAVPEQATAHGTLVGLGLREGYEPDALQHQPKEVTARLPAVGVSWSSRPARLVSARLLDDEVRWYDEAGVVLHTEPRLLPAIQETAFALAQDRFVVTDLDGRRTYTLQS